MSHQAENLQSLGPIVVAQKVVGGPMRYSLGSLNAVDSLLNQQLMS